MSLVAVVPYYKHAPTRALALSHLQRCVGQAAAEYPGWSPLAAIFCGQPSITSLRACAGHDHRAHGGASGGPGCAAARDGAGRPALRADPRPHAAGPGHVRGGCCGTRRKLSSLSSSMRRMLLSALALSGYCHARRGGPLRPAWLAGIAPLGRKPASPAIGSRSAAHAMTGEAAAACSLSWQHVQLREPQGQCILRLQAPNEQASAVHGVILTASAAP